MEKSPETTENIIQSEISLLKQENKSKKVPESTKKVKGLKPTKGSKLKQAKNNDDNLSSRPKKERIPKKPLLLNTQIAEQHQNPDELVEGGSPELSSKASSPTKRRNNALLYLLVENQECLGRFFLFKDNAFAWNPEANRPNNQSTSKAQRETALAIQGFDDLSAKELDFCKKVLLEGLSFPLKQNQIDMCHIISVDSVKDVLICFANAFSNPLQSLNISKVLDSAYMFFDEIFLDKNVIEDSREFIPLKKIDKMFNQCEEIRESISACLVYIAKSINIVEKLKALDYIYSVFESAPKNLRPGDSTTNSSIQENLDPHLYKYPITAEIEERAHSISIREKFNNWRATLNLGNLELLMKDDQVVSSSRPLLEERKDNLILEKSELE